VTGDYLLVDAEHHYYEPDDCFTRHLESAYRDRSVHVTRGPEGGAWFFGQKRLSKAGTTRDLVLPPGAYGARQGKADKTYPPMVAADLPEFTERKARLAVMDQQGLEAVIMLPSLTIHVEHDLRGDVEAAYANLRSFNRWVEEDWGYHYDERIFGVPYLSLLDVDLAIAELERVLALGTRLVMIKSGPVGGRSPADRHFDPFWARLNEAKIPFLIHLDNGGYTEYFSAAWGEDPNPLERDVTPFQWFTCFGSRPFMDTLALLILHNLFGRFPDLQLISVSNGTDWVRQILRLDNFADPSFPYIHNEDKWWPGGQLALRPSETLRKHVYVAPFIYDDVAGLVDIMGPERVLMASDYPHPEGCAEAGEFVTLLQTMPEGPTRQIMRDNTAGLLGLL
jgi:predicted TIM-barrel fold metal-dependent hydrolase